MCFTGEEYNTRAALARCHAQKSRGRKCAARFEMVEQNRGEENGMVEKENEDHFGYNGEQTS